MESGRVAGQIVDIFGGSGLVTCRTLVGRVGSGSTKVTSVHLLSVCRHSCSLFSLNLSTDLDAIR